MIMYKYTKEVSNLNSEYLVKMYRKRKKYTLVQMSEKLGICEKQYRRYEKDLSNVKIETFYRIADILELGIIEEVNLFSTIREELIKEDWGKINNGL